MDGSLASVLSSLSHHEKEGDSWLNPIQSPNTVRCFDGKAWPGRSWHSWRILCQADISPFTDGVVCNIYQCCWPYWSDCHNSLGSHGNFSYGVYPQELFWALLVHTSPFYCLYHLLRDARPGVRSSDPILKSQPLILDHSLSRAVLLLCFSGIVRGQTEESMGESHPYNCSSSFLEWDKHEWSCTRPHFVGHPPEVRMP